MFKLGSAAVQIAKYFGAEVTGVCSAANVDLVKSIGADRVIDYAVQSKFDDQYVIICDTIGVTSSAECNNALKSGGRLLLVAGELGQVLSAGSKADGKTIIAGPGKDSPEHVLF